jgi:hypothetical protein
MGHRRQRFEDEETKPIPQEPTESEPTEREPAEPEPAHPARGKRRGAASEPTPEAG